MSSTSLDPPGLIGNTAAGYRLAWARRQQLLSVLLPVLAPVLLGLVLLDLLPDLLLDRARLVIINGAPVVQDGADAGPAWARLSLIAVFWLLALLAGALAVTGAERGHAVRPGKAILAAARLLPVPVVLLGATYLVLKAVAGRFTLVLVLGTLAVAAVMSVRLLIALVAYRLGGSGWAHTRGRVTSTAGAFLTGGVAVPVLVAYLVGGLPPTVTLPVAASVIGTLLLTVVLAVQAGLVARICLLPGGSVDPIVLDARLAGLSGGTRRRPWLASAATVLAVLASAGVAVANPLGAPTVQSHQDAPGGAAAVVWPAGRHPVLATMTGAWFCDDDTCAHRDDRNGGPAVMDGRGSVGFSADGSVVLKAALTGGMDNGGPFIHYARCTRDGCPEAWLPVRASAKETFGWPELAAAVAPDQALWFGLAMPSAEQTPGKATYRITFIRCADARCATPQRHPGGTVERIVDDGSTDGQRARMSIGADGRPVLTVRTGVSAVRVTCDPVTCVAPTSTWGFAGRPDTAWVAPTDPAGQVRTFQPGMLRIGEQIVPLRSDAAPAPRSGALAVDGSRTYLTAAEATVRPGLHVTVGGGAEYESEPPRPQYWQQVLWRCDGPRCRRQVLDGFADTYGQELLAAAPDGRVLIVRQDRILLVSAPTPH
ncbi:hypothetical protein ACWKSP_14485 [Micromonosporaceae bacterium Da 78-11]